MAPAASYQPGIFIDCLDDAELSRLKELTIKAIDDAYADQVAHLFKTWMSDSRGQPRRAQAGASQAIVGWRDVRRNVSAFLPSQCTVTRAK